MMVVSQDKVRRLGGVLLKGTKVMKTAILCRGATTEDQNAIWQVRTASIKGLCKSHYGEKETEAWANASVPDDFAAVICGGDFLIAECDGIVVGFGFINRQTAEVKAIFVEPRFSRRGVGTAILTSLEAIARNAGLRQLTLSASLNAVSFYQAAGYRPIQETEWCHPAGFRLPCVAMAKTL
jgi:GNAT superfamily N-acetyltransferase